MSGQLRTLKKRIRSVENTKKITRAMEMVASSRLIRYQSMMTMAGPFTRGIENLMARTAAGSGPSPARQAASHPFFETRSGNKTAAVLITSDMGLCGSFNADILAAARDFFSGLASKPSVLAVGRAGLRGLRSMGLSAEHSLTDIRSGRIEEVLAKLRGILEEIFLSGKADRIYVIYSRPVTRFTYKPAAVKLLPLETAAAQTAEDAPGADYIFEPAKEHIFSRLVPVCFEAKLRMIFLESLVCEQTARMNAMHQATKNAEEIIDRLVLLRNKVRQAAITKEIIEIVSGAQALKIQ